MHVAFLVLVFATGNVILAMYAIISIFFIVFGVLGFVQSSLGWDLGVAESVAGIIIIGFSVDYTVHLGNEYIQGGREGYDDRISRVVYASRRIVSTVAAAAIHNICPELWRHEHFCVSCPPTAICASYGALVAPFFLGT